MHQNLLLYYVSIKEYLLIGGSSSDSKASDKLLICLMPTKSEISSVSSDCFLFYVLQIRYLDMHPS